MSNGYKGLRNYQAKTINMLFDKIKNGYKSVIVVLSCGAGKSTIFSKLCELCVHKQKKVLFIAHRQKLVLQFADRLKSQFGIDCNIIMGKLYSDMFPIYVASKDTLISKTFPDVDIVIIDECHRAEGARYKTIIDHYISNGKVVVGLTATPERLDGKGLASFETYINPVKMKWLIEQGYLVETLAYVVDTKYDYSTVKIGVNGDYAESGLYDLYDNNASYEEVVRAYNKISPGEPTIVFAININHSEKLKKEFEKYGIACGIVHSQIEEDQNKVYERFQNREFPVLINCNTLIEGADFDFITTVMLVRRTLSKMYYVQMVGRVQRKYEGKKYGKVIDFGNHHEIHPPVEEYDLQDFDIHRTKKEKRLEIPKEFQQKLCEKCEVANHPNSKVCKNCGNLFALVYEDVILASGLVMKILDKNAASFNRYRLMTQNEARKQHVGLLLYIAVVKGYKKGWAARVLQERDPENYGDAAWWELYKELEAQEAQLGVKEQRLEIEKLNLVKK